MTRINLRKGHRFQSKPIRLSNESKKYMPLFGIWLIDLALFFSWHECRSKNRWPDIFEDDNFCALSGLASLDEMEDEVEERQLAITTARCRSKLLMQRKKLQKMKLADDLPILNNIMLLGKLLVLNEAEKALLTFATGLKAIPEFREAISSRSEKTSISSLCQVLGKLTGIAEASLSKALHRDSILLTTGLLEISRHGRDDLDDKVNLMDELADTMLLHHGSPEELVSRFLKKAAPATLTLGNFPHLKRDATLLSVNRH